MSLGGGFSTSALSAAAVQAGQTDTEPAGTVNPVLKTLAIPITDLTTGEKDTLVDLPANCIVLDAFLYVRTVEATAGTKTIDIGLKASESGGDTDGFADALPTNVQYASRPGCTFTAGGNETYVSAILRGALLLAAGVLGADVAGDVGSYQEKPHIVKTGQARSVVYQLGSAHTELDADIVLLYVELA